MIYFYQKITSKIIRPIIPIVLKSKKSFILYSTLIDSGSDYCIFSIEIAQALSINLSKGKEVSFIGVGKEKVKGYRGNVEMRVDKSFYELKAIFAEISEFGHGILGQQGFFDHFDVKLSYQKQIIEIEPIKEINKN